MLGDLKVQLQISNLWETQVKFVLRLSSQKVQVKEMEPNCKNF